MKKLKDFTINEYLKIKELFSEEEYDYYEIFKLYGLELTKLDSTTFLNMKFEIENDIIPIAEPIVERYYKIGGVKYKATLNLTKITASQFIDLQTYIAKDDLCGILSIFLIPTYIKFLFEKTYKYNDGYDLLEVQKNIGENMKIVDAQNLSAFFLSQSEKLQKIIYNYSVKKLMKLKIKQQKQRQILLG